MMTDYQRIEKAIAYLAANAGEQPSLGQVAAYVHLSPFHFQRMFCQWAGISPKRFLQVLTLERGKEQLTRSRSLLEVSYKLGLSGGSRLYDHFVSLEAVTPGEYKNKGQDVTVRYAVHFTPFGPLFVAMTQRGVCRAGFTDYAAPEQQLAELESTWPLARFEQDSLATAEVVNRLFADEPAEKGPLSLHVAGTNFQIAVWRALLKIPAGAVTSYGELAASLGQPKAARAVGNAVGANPVALVIPCHRVIQESGALGGYRWGPGRKRVIQLWENLQ